MAVLFVASGVFASLWLEGGEGSEDFAHTLDRRAAHAAGILEPAEWQAMQAAGDLAAPASGGDGCASRTCRMAEAAVGGRWRAGPDCAVGNRYRFTDATAIVEDLAGDGIVGSTRRAYRVVSAPSQVPILSGADGRPLDRIVEKQPGDVEVWTLGSSAYVRRILRRIDPDTVALVLVQHRVGKAGPVLTLFADGRSTIDASEIAYRLCHPRSFG